MGRVLTATEVIGPELEQAKVIRWRKQWLVAGGFSMGNAETLANIPSVEKDYAIDLLKNAQAKGYDEAFVMELLT